MSVLYLPFITCLFWIVLNPFVHKKDKGFRALQLLLTVTGISALATAKLAFADENNTNQLCFFIRQFFAPLVISSAILYIHAIESRKKSVSYLLTGVAVPGSLLFAEIILLMLSDIDGILQFLHFCSVWVFYGILAAESLWFMIYTIFKSAKDLFTIHKQIFGTFILLYIVMDVSLINIPNIPSWIIILISVLLSASIFTLSYASIFHYKADLNISDLRKGFNEFIPELSNIDKACIAATSQIGQASPAKTSPVLQKSTTNGTTDISQSLTDEEYLRIRFEDLIITKELFLRQGIRISEIAAMLETNRTYISKLVNNTYGMSFSDYINTLRIEYAKQYLMQHTEIKQSDIAAVCGFPNASAFNNVFKKKTGVTPKIWLAIQS